MFQEDPDVKIALLALTAAGTGLTLTATSNIIFAEVKKNKNKFIVKKKKILMT